MGGKAAAEEGEAPPEVRETNANVFRVAGMAAAAANRTRERNPGHDG